MQNITKRKVLAIILVMAMIFPIGNSLLTQSTAAGETTITQGSGTESSPYQIFNFSQLGDMSAKGLDKHYILMSDIQASGTIWNSLGTTSKPFTGTFNGNGFTIYNFTIRASTARAGLFANTKGATIKNIVMLNAQINGINYLGSLIGDDSGNSLIEKCYVQGNVSGTGRVGGLIGNIGEMSSIRNSGFNGNVYGSASGVGSIAGHSRNGVVYRCYHIGIVQSTSQNVGGIVGTSELQSARISESSHIGSVNGTLNVGGIIGLGQGSINDCYSQGEVKGSSQRIGGIAGSFTSGNITRCYGSGSVSAYAKSGGIVGLFSADSLTYSVGAQSKVSSSYSGSTSDAHRVYTKTSAIAQMSSNAAFDDMIVEEAGAVQNIKSTNPAHSSEHGKNVTKSELTTSDAYWKSLTWDFNTIWKMPDTMPGYPVLRGVEAVRYIPVTGLDLSTTSASITEGQTITLTSNVKPSNANNQMVTWTSSDLTVATVSQDGLITAMKEGMAIITAKTAEGGYTAKCELTVLKAPQNLAKGKLIYASHTSGSNTASRAVDGNMDTRWGAPNNTSNVTLMIDFGEKVTFEQINIAEFGNRVNNFRIEYLDGAEWKILYTGTTIDTDFSIDFPPVTSSMVRLYVVSTEGTYGVSISEFEVYDKKISKPVEPPIVIENQDLALNSTVTASSISGSNTPKKAVDGDSATRWTAKSNTENVTFDIDFGKTVVFNQIKIHEYAERIDNYILQYWNGTDWIDIQSGTTIGTNFIAEFDNVTTTKLRLLVVSTNVTYGATISDFEVYFAK